MVILSGRLELLAAFQLNVISLQIAFNDRFKYEDEQSNTNILMEKAYFLSQSYFDRTDQTY